MSNPREYRAVRAPAKRRWHIEARKRLGQWSKIEPWSFTDRNAAESQIQQFIDDETDDGEFSTIYSRANPPPPQGGPPA